MQKLARDPGNLWGGRRGTFVKMERPEDYNKRKIQEKIPIPRRILIK
jgi:hypothetical protein